jgi:hypothetical protein
MATITLLYRVIKMDRWGLPINEITWQDLVEVGIFLGQSGQAFLVNVYQA